MHVLDPTVMWLLVAIVLLAACFFMVPESTDEPTPPGRDLEREHALGAHRETAAWGCKRCRER